MGLEILPFYPGAVPEYECREAAVYTHVPWATWLTMDGRERAAAVAHYRAHLLIEAHINDASEKASEAKQRRAKARNRG